MAVTHTTLSQRNADLEAQLLEMSEVSQRFRALRTENERLRQLLGSRSRLPQQVLIAELIGVIPTVNTFQVILDKGTDAGVRIGQAVIDAQGLFGQVIAADAFTSRVLLVVDETHAVPVEVNRNGVRSVAAGTGILDRLVLEFVPITADIRQGDLLVTSGLGGRFPRGYPVGTVESVVVESVSSFAEVVVRPAAYLDRSRHVLVVFEPEQVARDLADTANEVVTDQTAPETPQEETSQEEAVQQEAEQ